MDHNVDQCQCLYDGDNFLSMFGLIETVSCNSV